MRYIRLKGEAVRCTYIRRQRRKVGNLRDISTHYLSHMAEYSVPVARVYPCSLLVYMVDKIRPSS